MGEARACPVCGVRAVSMRSTCWIDIAGAERHAFTIRCGCCGTSIHAGSTRIEGQGELERFWDGGGWKLFTAMIGGGCDG